jgi:UDP:flavonoid glycosyltransferase YjiC (YdhE family)
MHLSAKRIRAAITLVLNDPGYREAAQSMQAKLHSINGACRAVEIMEDALEKHAVGAGTGELRT